MLVGHRIGQDHRHSGRSTPLCPVRFSPRRIRNASLESPLHIVEPQRLSDVEIVEVASHDLAVVAQSVGGIDEM